MNVHLYHAQYFGGPCDGCLVIGTNRPQESTWSMTVSMTEGRKRSTGDACKAVYKVRRVCHFVDLGMPTVRFEYEFFGLEPAAAATPRIVSGWWARATQHLKRLAQEILWLPRPEGRPLRPGQAAFRLMPCPGPGFGPDANLATIARPALNYDFASHRNGFQRDPAVKR